MSTISNSDEPTTTKAERPCLLGKELSEIVIAYISCPQDAARNYLGGILLTDYRTRPLEFAFVTPIKVSAIQRIIHGKTLDEAITVDVVANRLLSETAKQPDIIFVDSDILLELQRLTPIPVAKLSREENSAAQPNALSTLKFTTSPIADTGTVIGTVLSTLESSVDLTDPFNRVMEAMREAQKGIPQSQAKP